MDQLENDIWFQVERFASSARDRLAQLGWSSDRSFPATRINPSGRFQDLDLRNIQEIVYWISGKAEAREISDFVFYAWSYCDQLESDFEVDASEERSQVDWIIEAYEAESILLHESEAQTSNVIFVSAFEQLARAIAVESSALLSLSPRGFEEFVAELFYRNGFTVELTARSRDGGKDIIAMRSELNIPLKVIVECKRYSPENHVGIDVVQRLYGVKVAERAAVGIVATTSSFTKPALEFESTHPLDLSLKDGNAILEWVENMSNKTIQGAPFPLRYASLQCRP